MHPVRPEVARAFSVVLLGASSIVLALPAPTARAASLPDVIERIRPSIVGVAEVVPTRHPSGRFTGTAFVVADGRHAITNAHDVGETADAAGQTEFLAILVPRPGGGPEVRKLDVVEVDRAHDLALVAFGGEPLPAMKLGDSERVREGERYAFTGFPLGTNFGMRPTTHRGIVSAITPIAIPQVSSRRLDARMIERLRHPYAVFQLDATAYAGNSGSPLYRVDSGRVVGVINRVFVKETKENLLKGPSGITYAIPIEYARALLKKAGLAR